MKTREQIEKNIEEILDSYIDRHIQFDEHMKGYLSALEWVLERKDLKVGDKLKIAYIRIYYTDGSNRAIANRELKEVITKAKLK